MRRNGNWLCVGHRASSGIGVSLAEELALRGYDLMVCSAGTRLDDASAALTSYGNQVVPMQSDLATRRGIEELWTQVEAPRYIDVACLNAGVGVGCLFRDTDLDEELNLLSLNCSGAVQLAKYVVRRMLQQGRLKILFIASIAG